MSDETEKRPLWTDDKDSGVIDELIDLDSDMVAYNLYEDVLCLKEDLLNSIPVSKVEALAESFEQLVGCKIACDGVLLASARRYNEIVDLFNNLLSKPHKG